MNSLLTNTSAMVALQNLRTVNKDLTMVQEQISTGKKVSNARDNAAIFAISTVMQSDVKGFEAINQSLNLGTSSVGVARGAAEKITELLTDIKGLVVGAQEENVDRAKIQTDINQLKDQITSIVDAAQFNGLNFLKGSDTTNFLSSLDRDSSGNVSASNISAAGLNGIASTFVSGGGSADATADIANTSGSTMEIEIKVTNGSGGLSALAGLNVETDHSGALSDIEDLLDYAVDVAAEFGSAQKRIEIQNEFVSNLTDSLKTGIGALTDADLEAASARLQSLQVQQQLGIQALSIANQSPNSILGLFR